MTVTVWKNKIRVRHASLGKLRQKKDRVSWIRIRSDMRACFHRDTNQVVSSQSLNNKERQIDAWLVVLREENMIFDLFFLSIVE